MKEHFSIAIDGPGGAGKSTLAKAVAKKLNILHVDTGAIYRTIGYAAFSRGLDAKDESQIAPLLKEIQIDMAFDENSGQKMLLDGKDVSTEIRLPEISMYASNVSALPCVRAYLLEMQRDIARRRSVIMDGRDIGTVVLPDADVKIYLTAGADVRAQRRMKELAERAAAASSSPSAARPKRMKRYCARSTSATIRTCTATSPRCARQRMPCGSTRRSSTLKRASGRC